VGTFLIRFTSKDNGWLVVSYTDQGNQTSNNLKTQHCLINVDENVFVIFFQNDKGNQKAIRFNTIQELVHNCVPLTHLYPGTPKEEVFPVPKQARG
jgi:hypothetical protein